jgi:hypothetical protein
MCYASWSLRSTLHPARRVFVHSAIPSSQVYPLTWDMMVQGGFPDGLLASKVGGAAFEEGVASLLEVVWSPPCQQEAE